MLPAPRAAASEVTSGTARWGRSGFAVPVQGHSSSLHDQALPGHWALSALPEGRNCSSLVSKTVHSSKKMKPGNAWCSAAPFPQAGAAIRRDEAADPDGLSACSVLSATAGGREHRRSSPPRRE